MATLLTNQTQKTKHYQKNQQVKFLHLEAEVDILLQKLTALMQRKQVSSLTSKIPSLK
jgi:hypothetical protein